MIVENCSHVVVKQFDRLGIVNIQWGVIQDLLQLQAQIWHGQNNNYLKDMTLTYEVMSEILIIGMETWMTEKKPKTVNSLALCKNQS